MWNIFRIEFISKKRYTYVSYKEIVLLISKKSIQIMNIQINIYSDKVNKNQINVNTQRKIFQTKSSLLIQIASYIPKILSKLFSTVYCTLLKYYIRKVETIYGFLTATMWLLLQLIYIITNIAENKNFNQSSSDQLDKKIELFILLIF